MEGAVEQGGSSLALSPSERSAGYALICTAVPVSDCTLDAGAMELTEDEFASGDRTGVFIAEVESKEVLAPGIRRLYLRLVEPSKIKSTAGQFVNVEVPASQKLRAYSMAHPPSDRHHVELIVKLIPDGAFSAHLEPSLSNVIACAYSGRSAIKSASFISRHSGDRWRLGHGANSLDAC